MFAAPRVDIVHFIFHFTTSRNDSIDKSSGENIFMASCGGQMSVFLVNVEFPHYNLNALGPDKREYKSI